jgi:hypothetical protein
MCGNERYPRLTVSAWDYVEMMVMRWCLQRTVRFRYTGCQGLVGRKLRS